MRGLQSGILWDGTEQQTVCCVFCNLFIPSNAVLSCSASKFDEVEEKKLLQDKTEFQEVEVDMQLAGVQAEESDDEDYVVPSDDDYKPKKKLTGYEVCVWGGRRGILVISRYLIEILNVGIPGCSQSTSS